MDKHGASRILGRRRGREHCPAPPCQRWWSVHPTSNAMQLSFCLYLHLSKQFSKFWILKRTRVSGCHNFSFFILSILPYPFRRLTRRLNRQVKRLFPLVYSQVKRQVVTLLVWDVTLQETLQLKTVLWRNFFFIRIRNLLWDPSPTLSRTVWFRLSGYSFVRTPGKPPLCTASGLPHEPSSRAR